MEADEIEDLKEMIAVARKRDVSFALCLGKTIEDTGLLMHRIKPPDVLQRKVKKLDGVVPNKNTLGTARAKGRKLMLTCLEEPPPNARRLLKKFLIEIDMPMKVILLDASGSVLEEDDEDDEGDRDMARPTEQSTEFADLTRVNDGWIPEDALDRATGRWRKARRLVGPRILSYAKGGTPDAPGVGQSLARALQLGDERNDPEGAYRMLERIVGQIKAAKAARVSEVPEQEEDAMALFKSEARRARRRIDDDNGEEAAELRAALIEAVQLAHGGDPVTATTLLQKAARSRKPGA